MKRIFCLFGLGAFLAFGLTGCDTLDEWFSADSKPKLAGERETVLAALEAPKADPAVADVPVVLPEATENQEWAQAGGQPDHVMGHLALSDQPKVAWRVSVGEGSGGGARLLSAPIVSQGRVFAMDAAGNVAAFAEEDGKRLWRSLLAGDDDDATGGGIAGADGRLYATLGQGDVVALSADKGEVLWRVNLKAPLRAAPTVVGDRVYVVTVENETHALDAANGNEVWSHRGILESASLLGGAAPAVVADTVYAAYSSGEVYALRAATGRTAWSDTLAAAGRIGAMLSLADIRGLPVFDRGLLIATSHSGRLAAIDARTGARVWDQAIGGTQTPWVAGDFVYQISNGGQILAFTRLQGRLRWVADLPRFEDPDGRKSIILWAGPVAAGGRLWVAGSDGRLLALSPRTGDVAMALALGDSVQVPPVVAARTLFVVTEGGDLIAIR